MIQSAGGRKTKKPMTARQREVNRMRAEAELLLRSACELMESPGADRAQTGELAYQYSMEALVLLDQVHHLAASD